MGPYTADISVITVVLNDKSGLQRAIGSVQRQQSLVIEHLIVDGGSTDGSSELASQFSSIPIPSKPDGGIYPAMQRGAIVASGEYLVFCNSNFISFLKISKFEVSVHNLAFECKQSEKKLFI
jgi:glycosyltransferase involved in cell wall biosynthesis